MTTKKMMMVAGLGALAVYLLKKRKTTTGQQKEEGILQKFTNRVTEKFSQDLGEVADGIPGRPVNA